MFTPSGRFKPGMRLCLSISDYHPKTWNPAWSVSTILTGLLSFMVSDESTAGSISSSKETRIKLSKASRSYNSSLNAAFIEQFPEIVEDNKKFILEQERQHQKSHEQNESGVLDKSKSSSSDLNESGSNDKNSNTSTEEITTPSDLKNAPNTDNKKGLSTSQKVICVSLLFVSWVVASRLFS